jgi:hypothetical protein
MPDLTFTVEGASPVAHALSPQIALAVRVANSDPTRPVQSALLRCQIQIDAAARSYAPRESEALRDLFGEGSVRGRAMRRLAWTQAAVVVPPFTHDATFDVHAPCTFDMCIATAKYFRALLEGGAPVALLFSGTVFHREGDGELRTAPVPWSTEARYTIPGQVWRDAIEDHYAGITPVPLRRDLFDRLDRYRRDNALPTWDHVIDRLLPPVDRDVERGADQSADRGAERGAS